MRILLVTCVLLLGAHGCKLLSQRESESLAHYEPSGIRIGGAAAESRVKALVLISSCASHEFKGQGLAPKGYLKGMALTYAKSYCEAKRGEKTAVAVMQSPLRSDRKDALDHYKLTSVDPIVRLRALYTLGLGEALRESSGNSTEGFDTTVRVQSSRTAEAGLFQTSFDSTNYQGVTVDGVEYEGAKFWLNSLMAQYKADPSTCNYDVFMEGMKKSRVNVVGSSEGAEFQSFSRECPAFATEYALVIFRLNRNHYGPINRKEAEYSMSCHNMLEQV